MTNTVRTEDITEELKNEVLTYWRDTAKDKNALARVCDLFGLKEEDARRIIAVRWEKKKFPWTKDNVFRLKAYMAQGMKMVDIAKQLGCPVQAIYDDNRRHKGEAKDSEVAPGSAPDVVPEKNASASQIEELHQKDNSAVDYKAEYDRMVEKYIDLDSAVSRMEDVLHELEIICEAAIKAGVQYNEVEDRSEGFEMLAFMVGLMPEKIKKLQKVLDDCDAL